MQLEILYEDNHLLAVNKPAGISTMGETGGTPTVLTIAKQYIRSKYNKPGNVYLGVVSRLDKPVSGLLLLARTSKAAARLNRSFQQRRVEKRYWGIVTAARHLPPESRLRDWLRKNEADRRMECCPQQANGAQLAELRFWTHYQHHGRAWLEIELITGRKHQIRVQLAAAGAHDRW